MTKEEVIRELRACHSYTKKAEALLEQRARLRAKLYNPRQDMTPDKIHTAPENMLERLTEQIDALERQLSGLISENVQKRFAAEDLIRLADDPRGQAVLELYYLHRRPMWMVGRDLHYSQRQAWRLHDSALDSVVAKKMAHYGTV